MSWLLATSYPSKFVCVPTTRVSDWAPVVSLPAARQPITWFMLSKLTSPCVLSCSTRPFDAIPPDLLLSGLWMKTYMQQEDVIEHRVGTTPSFRGSDVTTRKVGVFMEHGRSNCGQMSFLKPSMVHMPVRVKPGLHGESLNLTATNACRT